MEDKSTSILVEINQARPLRPDFRKQRDSRWPILLPLCAVVSSITLLALSGCGQGAPPASTEPEKTVEISGNDQMKYDVTSFDVKPGQKVKVIFKNVGTMPKQSMGHNFVVLQKNTDPAKFVDAGFTQASNDYIDPAMAKSVIAKTKTLGPGESETITFTAPRIPSSYDFVCTFPGHFASGMRGQMIVQ